MDGWSNRKIEKQRNRDSEAIERAIEIEIEREK
jgi:hypothetical protein